MEDCSAPRKTETHKGTRDDDDDGEPLPNPPEVSAADSASTTSAFDCVVWARHGQPVVHLLANFPVAESWPQTTVKWYRENEELVPDETKHGASFRPDHGAVELSIRHVVSADAGQYTVVASSPAGEAMLTARLAVQSPESGSATDHRTSDTHLMPSVLLLPMEDQKVTVGKRARFTVAACHPPEPRVYWFRDERLLKSSTERIQIGQQGGVCTLDIAAVEPDDDGTKWKCEIVTGFGYAVTVARLRTIVPKGYRRPEFLEKLKAALTVQGTVSLECKVVGVPTPQLRWFKGEKEIRAGDMFNVGLQSDGGGGDDGDVNSLGVYTCVAKNCMGDAISSAQVSVTDGLDCGRGQQLKVEEPTPVFIRGLEDTTTKVGDNFRFYVRVRTPPPVQLEWYHEDELLDAGSSSGCASDKYRLTRVDEGSHCLDVLPMELTDNGLWRCVAANQHGRVTSQCTVTLIVPNNYRKPEFVEDLVAVFTDDGLVSFECKVVGVPTPILRWYKDAMELKPGDIHQLSGTRSLGKYSCIARNCMGSAASVAELTIDDIYGAKERRKPPAKHPPRFTQHLKDQGAFIGQDFRFTVAVTCPPIPEVTWYKDNVRFEETSRLRLGREKNGIYHLDIAALQQADQGVWKCLAVNDYGHSLTQCALSVTYPKQYKKPMFIENLRAVLSEEGTVSLECKVVGVPQPVLKWYKDGVELKAGDIYKIVSGDSGTSSLGTYTCEATNCMGSASSTAALLAFDDKCLRDRLQSDVYQRELSTITERDEFSTYGTTVSGFGAANERTWDRAETEFSVYDTPDITEDEARQIVELFADECSEYVSTKDAPSELPPLRFVKESAVVGNVLMEALIIDVPMLECFSRADDFDLDQLATEAGVADFSLVDPLVVDAPSAIEGGASLHELLIDISSAESGVVIRETSVINEPVVATKPPLVVQNENPQLAKDMVDMDEEEEEEGDSFSDQVTPSDNLCTDADVESIASLDEFASDCVAAGSAEEAAILERSHLETPVVPLRADDADDMGRATPTCMYVSAMESPPLPAKMPIEATKATPSCSRMATRYDDPDVRHNQPRLLMEISSDVLRVKANDHVERSNVEDIRQVLPEMEDPCPNMQDRSKDLVQRSDVVDDDVQQLPRMEDGSTKMDKETKLQEDDGLALAASLNNNQVFCVAGSISVADGQRFAADLEVAPAPSSMTQQQDYENEHESPLEPSSVEAEATTVNQKTGSAGVLDESDKHLEGTPHDDVQTEIPDDSNTPEVEMAMDSVVQNEIVQSESSVQKFPPEVPSQSNLDAAKMEKSPDIPAMPSTPVTATNTPSDVIASEEQRQVEDVHQGEAIVDGIKDDGQMAEVQQMNNKMEHPTPVEASLHALSPAEADNKVCPLVEQRKPAAVSILSREVSEPQMNTLVVEDALVMETVGSTCSDSMDEVIGVALADILNEETLEAAPLEDAAANEFEEEQAVAMETVEGEHATQLARPSLTPFEGVKLMDIMDIDGEKLPPDVGAESIQSRLCLDAEETHLQAEEKSSNLNSEDDDIGIDVLNGNKEMSDKLDRPSLVAAQAENNLADEEIIKNVTLEELKGFQLLETFTMSFKHVLLDKSQDVILDKSGDVILEKSQDSILENSQDLGLASSDSGIAQNAGSDLSQDGILQVSDATNVHEKAHQSDAPKLNGDDDIDLELFLSQDVESKMAENGNLKLIQDGGSQLSEDLKIKTIDDNVNNVTNFEVGLANDVAKLDASDQVNFVKKSDDLSNAEESDKPSEAAEMAIDVDKPEAVHLEATAVENLQKSQDFNKDKCAEIVDTAEHAESAKKASLEQEFSKTSHVDDEVVQQQTEDIVDAVLNEQLEIPTTDNHGPREIIAQLKKQPEVSMSLEEIASNDDDDVHCPTMDALDSQVQDQQPSDTAEMDTNKRQEELSADRRTATMDLFEKLAEQLVATCIIRALQETTDANNKPRPTSSSLDDKVGGGNDGAAQQTKTKKKTKTTLKPKLQKQQSQPQPRPKRLQIKRSSSASASISATAIAQFASEKSYAWLHAVLDSFKGLVIEWQAEAEATAENRAKVDVDSGPERPSNAAGLVPEMDEAMPIGDGQTLASNERPAMDATDLQQGSLSPIDEQSPRNGPKECERGASQEVQEESLQSTLTLDSVQEEQIAEILSESSDFPRSEGGKESRLLRRNSRKEKFRRSSRQKSEDNVSLRSQDSREGSSTGDLTDEETPLNPATQPSDAKDKRQTPAATTDQHQQHRQGKKATRTTSGGDLGRIHELDETNRRLSCPQVVAPLPQITETQPESPRDRNLPLPPVELGVAAEEPGLIMEAEGESAESQIGSEATDKSQPSNGAIKKNEDDGAPSGLSEMAMTFSEEQPIEQIQENSEMKRSTAMSFYEEQQEEQIQEANSELERSKATAVSETQHEQEKQELKLAHKQNQEIDKIKCSRTEEQKEQKLNVEHKQELKLEQKNEKQKKSKQKQVQEEKANAKEKAKAKEKEVKDKEKEQKLELGRTLKTECENEFIKIDDQIRPECDRLEGSKNAQSINSDENPGEVIEEYQDQPTMPQLDMVQVNATGQMETVENGQGTEHLVSTRDSIQVEIVEEDKIADCGHGHDGPRDKEPPLLQNCQQQSLTQVHSLKEGSKNANQLPVSGVITNGFVNSDASSSTEEQSVEGRRDGVQLASKTTSNGENEIALPVELMDNEQEAEAAAEEQNGREARSSEFSKIKEELRRFNLDEVAKVGKMTIEELGSSFEEDSDLATLLDRDVIVESAATTTTTGKTIGSDEDDTLVGHDDDDIESLMEIEEIPLEDFTMENVLDNMRTLRRLQTITEVDEISDSEHLIATLEPCWDDDHQQTTNKDKRARSLQPPSVRTTSVVGGTLTQDGGDDHRQRRSSQGDNGHLTGQTTDNKRKKTADSPSFIMKLRDMTIPMDYRMRLTCCAIGTPDPKVTWLKNGAPITPDMGYREISDFGICVLEIPRASASDAGTFTCIARNEHGDDSTTAQLTVKGKARPNPVEPAFTRSMLNMRGQCGDSVTMDCTVIGWPTPDVLWFKDNEPLVLDDKDGRVETKVAEGGGGTHRLVIRDAECTDSGVYRCVARNPHGRDEITAYVKITDKRTSPTSRFARDSLLLRRTSPSTTPSGAASVTSFESPPLFFAAPLKDSTVRLGGDVTLQCQLLQLPLPGQGRDYLQVCWLHNGQPLPQSSSGGHQRLGRTRDGANYTLTLLGVSYSDLGTYTCKVSDGVRGTTAYTSARLSFGLQGEDMEFGLAPVFIAKPQSLSVAKDQPIVLTCKVEGAPRPKITWLKGARDMSLSRRAYKDSKGDIHKLVIHRAMNVDDGEYVVEARNKLGIEVVRCSVTVSKPHGEEDEDSWDYQRTTSALRRIGYRPYVPRKELPSAVGSQPRITETGRNWATLVWQRPDNDGGSCILAYRIEARELPSDAWEEVGLSPITICDAYNLKADSEYLFRVSARNMFGWGPPLATERPLKIVRRPEVPYFESIAPAFLHTDIGRTVIVECSVGFSKPAPDIRWLKNGRKMGASSRRQTAFDGATATLAIVDVDAEDEGCYVCEAVSDGGRATSTTVLCVHEELDERQSYSDGRGSHGSPLSSAREENWEPRPPVIVSRLEGETFAPGGRVTLRCQVLGSPAPTVKWLKDGVEIMDIAAAVEHDRNGDRHRVHHRREGSVYLVEIARSLAEDAGEYSIQAGNEYGSASCSCPLALLRDDDGRSRGRPTIVEPLKNGTAIEGQTYTLQCRASSTGRDSLMVSWNCDGRTLSHSRKHRTKVLADGTFTLTVVGVTSDDSGTYACVIANDVGTTSTRAEVRVEPSDKGLDNSRPSSLSSSPLGWNQTLHTGYSKVPVFLTKPRSTEVLEYDSVELLCEVIGDPKPEVLWLRDGLTFDYERHPEHFRRLGDGPLYRLEIATVAIEDTGAYAIVARNCHGEAKAVVSLQVFARGQSGGLEEHQMAHRTQNKMATPTAPAGNVATRPEVTRPLTDRECTDGDAVTLECRVEAVPQPDIRWEKDGHVLKQGDDFRMERETRTGTCRLTIGEAFPEDVGEYACVAYTDAGTVATKARLTVRRRLNGVSSAAKGAAGASPAIRKRPVSTIERSRPSGSSKRSSGPKFVTHPHNRVVDEGETVKFTCCLSGHPNPGVRWEKCGQPVTSDGARIQVVDREDLHTLAIAEVTARDAGTYTVTGANCVGRVFTSVHLDVIGKRRGKLHSQLLTPASASSSSNGPRTCGRVFNVAAFEGPRVLQPLADQTIRSSCVDRLAMSCQVVGKPRPTVSWTVNGKCVPRSWTSRSRYDGRTASLEIVGRLLRPDDGSPSLDVCCTAFNAHGTVRTYARLTSLGSAKLLVKRNSADALPNVQTITSQRPSDKAETCASELVTSRRTKSIELDQKDVIAVVNADKEGGMDGSMSCQLPAEPPHVLKKQLATTTKRHRDSGVMKAASSTVPADWVEDRSSTNTSRESQKTTAENAKTMVEEDEEDAQINHNKQNGGTSGNQQKKPEAEEGAPNGSDWAASAEIQTIHQAAGSGRRRRFSREWMSSKAVHQQLELLDQDRVCVEDGSHFDDLYDVVGAELGKGRFGSVRLLTEKETGDQFAGKFVRCINARDKDKVKEEVDIMNRLGHHPKIIDLMAAYERCREIILVLEYIAGGELFERIVDEDFIPTERDCILFARQICDGIRYVHGRSVMHLDLKPENIMCIERDGHRVKLIDFGLAKLYEPDRPVRAMFGTPEFVAPEVINYEPLSLASDMWSVGVVCYVMLSGLSPFMGENDAQTFANITRNAFDFDDEAFDGISQDALDFIVGLLVNRKEERMSAEQCLQHRWINQNERTMSEARISTEKLKKFIIRRRWQKTGNAILALGRMVSLSDENNRHRQQPKPRPPLHSVSSGYLSDLSDSGTAPASADSLVPNCRDSSSPQVLQEARPPHLDGDDFGPAAVRSWPSAHSTALSGEQAGWPDDPTSTTIRESNENESLNASN